MSDFAQTVKQQADIVKVIEGYIRLRKAGAQNYQGYARFTRKNRRRFPSMRCASFNHCFGCQASGDVFSFCEQDKNVGFPEAVRIVGGKMRDSAAQARVFLAGRGCRSAAASQAAGVARDGYRMFEEQLRGPEGAVAP